MKQVLITTIGTGRRTKEGGYDLTTYRFSNNKEYTTPLFAEAIIEHYQGELSQVVVVGTETSSWDSLIASTNDKYDDLKLALDECRDKGKTDPALLQQLKEVLENIYSLPFSLYVHGETVDSSTISSIFEQYFKISRELPADQSVLFDITHGFRSMPLMMYQTLQYSAATNEGKDINLIYGEYIKEDKVSHVRDLSNYWHYAQVTNALHLWQQRYDGALLARLVEKKWPALAKWLRNFTDTIAANFVLQVDVLMRQLSNTLKNPPLKLEWWIIELKQELELFVQNINKQEKQSRKILILADILASKKMFTQAIIALQISVECFTLEALGSDDKIGDYEYYQNMGKEQRRFLLSELNNKDARSSLNDLQGNRNQVAHGGTESFGGAKPNAQNMPSQYDRYRRAVSVLYKL